MSIKDVFKARLRIRMLEDEVERPMNVHRWRALEVSRVTRLHFAIADCLSSYCFQLQWRNMAFLKS